MKVALFSPYATVVPHFDTELDIAQQHLDRGDEVVFVNCRGGLANCDFNPDRDPLRCQQCVGRREMGLELLQPNVAERLFSESAVPMGSLRNDFHSVADLIDYRIENFDIGYAALSSLVSICRDPEPDLIKHRDLLHRFLQAAWQTYRTTREYLHQQNPDRVYVFNGRFAAMRAVLRACQAEGVDCFLHERGCDGEHFDLWKNHLLHDIPAIEQVIRQTWNAAEKNPQRDQIGSQWYLDRVNRVERNWHSFVKDQQTGTLPVAWNRSKHNVTIFCSSDDEFVAIGDCWKNELYPDQVTAISRIATSLLEIDRNVQITLRAHPNLTNVDNQRKREMLALNFPNLTVVPPDSPIDSYELMRASDCVASFGSSVGMEAVFWGLPSVLLGPCLYQNLGGVYRSENHAETVRLLRCQLSPQPKTAALVYGFWFQTRGFQHRYFQSDGLFEGRFKGQTLYARPPKKTLATRIRREARKLLLRK